MALVYATQAGIDWEDDMNWRDGKDGMNWRSGKGGMNWQDWRDDWDCKNARNDISLSLRSFRPLSRIKNFGRY